MNLGYAPWFLWTYAAVARTSWYYGYPETDGGAASCRGNGFVTACDEWPWQTTEQGGEAARPLPHLKIIDYTQNSASGGRYGGFVTQCALAARKESADPAYGRGNFLVIPLPAALAPAPSLKLCNGPNPAP